MGTKIDDIINEILLGHNKEKKQSRSPNSKPLGDQVRGSRKKNTVEATALRSVPLLGESTLEYVYCMIYMSTYT